MGSSVRAAEMAEIISEEWDSEAERAEQFVMRRFPNDKVTDFAAAVEIMTELAIAEGHVDDEDEEGVTKWLRARRAERKL